MCSRSQLEPGLAPGVNHLLAHTFQVNGIQTKEKKDESHTNIAVLRRDRQIQFVQKGIRKNKLEENSVKKKKQPK